jgi:hypothetical protein
LKLATIRIDGEDVQIGIRPHVATDIPIIFNSWLESYRVGDEPRKMGNDLYFRNHHRLVTELASRAGVQVLVACATDDIDQVFGWACAEPASRVVHYVFSKKPFRESGIAAQLIATFAEEHRWAPDSEVFATHHTFFLDKVCKRSERWRRRIVYNPYKRGAS